MWTADDGPIDLAASWPTPVVTMVVTAFSKPGERVVLLPGPTATTQAFGARSRLGVVDAHGGIRHAPRASLDDYNITDLGDAVTAVNGLDRRGRMVHIATDVDPIRPSHPQPVEALDRAPVTASETSLSEAQRGAVDGLAAVAPDEVGRADLVITSLCPERNGAPLGDLVALVAARLLRVGGILVVLTHCDWSQGELIDPTGAAVASAQNADLLYLQHIIALHTPVRDGRFATELLTDLDDSADETQARAAHRAAVRGLPAPHRRIHSDVLVFAQPHHHDHPVDRHERGVAQTFASGAAR